MRAQEEYQAHLRRLERTLSGPALQAERYRAQKQHFARLDALLDRVHYGPRWLAQDACAQIVAACIHEPAPTYYHLHAFCIMPNHVHLLIDQQDIPEPDGRADGRTYTALSRAMRLLKGKSAALCNRHLGRRGPFLAARKLRPSGAQRRGIRADSGLHRQQPGPCRTDTGLREVAVHVHRFVVGATASASFVQSEGESFKSA